MNPSCQPLLTSPDRQRPTCPAWHILLHVLAWPGRSSNDLEPQLCLHKKSPSNFLRPIHPLGRTKIPLPGVSRGKKSSVFYQLNKYWPFLQVCLPLSWLSLYDMCVYMETGWGQQEGSDQFPKRSGTRLSSLWAIPQKAGIG